MLAERKTGQLADFVQVPLRIQGVSAFIKKLQERPVHPP